VAVSTPVFKASCEYTDKDKATIQGIIISTILISLFTIGSINPLPLTDARYFQIDGFVTGSAIVSFDAYWSWAFIGGNFALGLAAVISALLYSRKTPESKKKLSDVLILVSFTFAGVVATLTAGVYETSLLDNYRIIGYIVQALYFAALLIALFVRKGIKLRHMIILEPLNAV
jgi:hypothetical protein